MNILLQYDPESKALRKKDGTLICYVTAELEDHELKDDHEEHSIYYNPDAFKSNESDDEISKRIINAKNPYNERESIIAEITGDDLDKAATNVLFPENSEKKLIEDLERLKNIFTVDEIIKLSDAGLI